MDGQPEPVPDLDKLPPPPPPVVPEPTWVGHPPRCFKCGREPQQHVNPHGARWWACWELDAIGASIDYAQLSWWRQLRTKRPPLLMRNPGYVPGEPGHPSCLHQPETFWHYLRSRIGRRQ